MRRTAVVLLVLTLGAVWSPAALAAPGDLDLRFGNQGKVRTNLTSGSDWARGIAVQPNGRIVVVGSTEGRGGRFAVLRYNPGGKLDRSFSGDGVARVDFADEGDAADDLALQDDGKIVVVGSIEVSNDTSFAIVRFNADGTLDASFGDNGKVITDFLPPGNPGDVEEAYARSVTIQDDGKIVVAGSTETSDCGSGDFALARYNPDGTLDSSFGDGGRVTTNVSSLEELSDGAADVALQADGKIVAVGSANGCGHTVRFGVARYNADGTLDSTFDGDGKLTTTFVGTSPAAAVALQTDGKIVAAGRTGGKGGRFALIRYETDGALDTTFGGDGRTARDFTPGRDRATDVVVQPNGMILTVGIAGRGDTRFALTRFYPDGGFDPFFGKVLTNVSAREDSAEAVAIQNPTRVVAAGVANNGVGRDSWIALARYEAGGPP